MNNTFQLTEGQRKSCEAILLTVAESCAADSIEHGIGRGTRGKVFMAVRIPGNETIISYRIVQSGAVTEAKRTTQWTGGVTIDQTA